MKNICNKFGNSCVLFIFILISFFGGSFALLNFEKILFWDEFVDLGEYGLSVRDWGKGQPTVIIEGGLNQPKHKYFLLSLFTSAISRTIAYDHSGIGNSTKSLNPRTIPFYVEELRRLMSKKNIKPPFILVGHSSGGFIIRYYAYLYPEEVSGLVFIDAPHEDWFEHIRRNWTESEITQYFRWWYSDNPDMTDTETLEKLKYEENCDLVRNTKMPSNMLVLMFTGNNVGHFRKNDPGRTEDMKAWAELQHSLIAHLPEAEHIVDWETGHYPFKDKPIKIVRKINGFISEIKDNMKVNGHDAPRLYYKEAYGSARQ